MIIRDALPGELRDVGKLRVAAYVAGGFLSPDSEYAPQLASLGADGKGQILVAVRQDGQLAGTAMLQPWPHTELATGPDEAEIRALAVDPGGQRAGTGSALLQAIIDRARGAGVRHLVLYTQSDMAAAQRMYQRAGFTRLADRDWAVMPELTLLAYGLQLSQDK
ncbi:MAG TPA: GNAT family N-acetyltransferase [Streptosporangiaceae bacterium]